MFSSFSLRKTFCNSVFTKKYLRITLVHFLWDIRASSAICCSHSSVLLPQRVGKLKIRLKDFFSYRTSYLFLYLFG